MDAKRDHHRAHPDSGPRFSMRTRITLWVILVFSIIQFTLSLVILLYQRQAIYIAADSSLEKYSSAVAELVANIDSVDSLPGSVPLSGLRGSVTGGDAVGVLVFDPEQDALIDTAGPLGGNLAALRPTIRGRDWRDGAVVRLTDENGTPIAVSVRDVPRRDGQKLRVYVAVSDAATIRSIRLVANVLLLGVPSTLIGTAVASWIVSGIAVRPLRQIGDFAAGLGPGTIGDEVEIDGRSSEAALLRSKLQGAMERIERAYEEQGRFLANISHEIKTPISVIQAEADVLLMKPSDPAEMKRFVRSASEEMHRLGSMIESFLLLARVGTGNSRIRRSRLQVNDIVLEAYEQSAGMAAMHSVRLVPTLCEDDDDLYVRGNADLLATAIGNLVRNAIRFSTEGDTVELTCGVENGAAVISVRDRGSGISPDVLDRLFEPYTQASSERRRGRGTGLGLQIAKGIAEIHQGDIRAENLDKGCVFRMSIPLIRSGDAPAATSENPAGPDRPDAAPRETCEGSVRRNAE